MILGYILIFWAAIYAQISASDTGGALISRGLDAGLSIALLIVGLIIVGWYHWKYQKRTADQIDELSKDKDEKVERYHELALKQMQLSTEQLQSNKELRQTLARIADKLDNLDKLR